MRHSVVTWDSTYRNFFHLIDGMIAQDYPKQEYELIYIEQRSKAFANSYAAKENVQSLEDKYNEVKDKINIRIEYLNEPATNPYHLGKCNNKGIELANGEYISVMDGDQLLPPDFLHSLDEFFAKGESVANIVRRMAKEPVGVPKTEWKNAVIDFNQCLQKCPDKRDSIPQVVKNKGPLISAQRDHWDEINGYSEHHIWSTGLSKLGRDVCKRLEMKTGNKSRALPDTVAVHPWHPTGFNRETIKNRKLLYLQQQLIEWTEKNGVTDWKQRVREKTEAVYRENKEYIDKITQKDSLALPGQAGFNSPTLLDQLLDRVIDRVPNQLLTFIAKNIY